MGRGTAWTAAPQGKRVPARAGERSWEFLCFVSREDSEQPVHCVLGAHAASSLDSSGRMGSSWLFSGAVFPALKDPEPRSQHSSAEGPRERGVWPAAAL